MQPERALRCVDEPRARNANGRILDKHKIRLT
jgi:hypothetical protein